jgi:diguanylate cyclase (GGDEF)-like protein
MQIVDHLAKLTGFRDRDALDASLAAALCDILAPLSVSIHRCVGDPEEQHWMTRARMAPGDLVASSDPIWTDIGSLPALADFADRLACLQSRRVLAVAVGGGAPVCTHFPLTVDGDSLGVLQIETPAPLPPEMLRTVNGFLRVFRNFQALLDYSERDTLTGLLNRKTFDESFLRWLAPAVAPALPAGDGGGGRRTTESGTLCLGVIDIDHFKRVNDSCGHLIGDEVLLLLSRLMRSSFRFQDQLYRFGGEEFVVLMHCAQASDAAIAFERLRRHVESHAFPQIGHITISVGYTELRTDDSPATAFDRADKAVYHAKQHGRNQVQHHAALVAAGQLLVESRASDIELF